MSNRLAAQRALDRARAQYEADGYEVTLNQPLPSPFEAFVADAVARRTDETIIVEVRSADITDSTGNRLARLGEIVRNKAGWRVDLITFQPEKPLPKPDIRDILRRIQEAGRVAKLSPEASVMLTWSALEGTLLNLHPRRDTPRRAMPAPRELIRELTIEGVLSDAQADRLDESARLSHEIAHGRPSGTIDQDQLEWATRFALAAGQGQIATIENMVEWFQENQGRLGAAGLPGASGAGRGTRNDRRPAEVEAALRRQFAAALAPDTAEAVEEIATDRDSRWAARRAV